MYMYLVPYLQSRILSSLGGNIHRWSRCQEFVSCVDCFGLSKAWWCANLSIVGCSLPKKTIGIFRKEKGGFSPALSSMKVMKGVVKLQPTNQQDCYYVSIYSQAVCRLMDLDSWAWQQWSQTSPNLPLRPLHCYLMTRSACYNITPLVS